MEPQPVSSQDELAIDQGILALREAHPRMMFSDLARALPSHSWHALFSALGRLSRQACVDLVVHQWDYEVVFLPLTASVRPGDADESSGE